MTTFTATQGYQKMPKTPNTPKPKDKEEYAKQYIHHKIPA
jgi:hypothetical protein